MHGREAHACIMHGRENHARSMHGMVDLCMYHAWIMHDTCIHAWNTLKHACFMYRISSRVARLHYRKSVCWPKKFDLVHQTVSPCERVGSGDETSVCVCVCVCVCA